MADDMKPMPGYGLLRWIAVLLMIVLVFGFWTLWRVYELRDCCERIEKLIPKPTPEPKPKSGPGPGPIISVGPRTGSSGALETHWEIDDGTGTRDVIFEEDNHLRTDMAGSLMKLQAQSGSTSYAIRWATVPLASGDALTITDGSSGVSWSWSGTAFVPCDYESGGAVDDCAHDGIPLMFDGEIDTAIVFPSGVPSGAKAVVREK